MPSLFLNPRQLAMPQAQSGFALVMVLFLSVLITTMIPLMLNLNRETTTNVQQNQSRVLASGYARQVFMTAHAQMLMNGGLPLGWARGDAVALNTPDRIADLSNCSRLMGLSEDWNQVNARVSWMSIDSTGIPLDGTKIIAGISRIADEDVPYERYIVLGCVLTDGVLAQGAVMRGEYARAGHQLLMLSLRSETS